MGKIVSNSEHHFLNLTFIRYFIMPIKSYLSSSRKLLHCISPSPLSFDSASQKAPLSKVLRPICFFLIFFIQRGLFKKNLTLPLCFNDSKNSPRSNLDILRWLLKKETKDKLWRIGFGKFSVKNYFLTHYF